jgi:predicted secreted hydrolase
MRKAWPTLIAFILVFATLLSVWAADFETAKPGRKPAFPKDHGNHPGFKSEWWYFTGNLRSEDGRSFGFQLTFFRFALEAGNAETSSAWAVKDVYPAHFAITSVDSNEFHYADLISRRGPALARASEDDLDVGIRNWSAARGDEGIKLIAHDKGFALDLKLAPEKPLTLHGNAGFSQKGESPDQASYYYSFTRLNALGALTWKGKRYAVTGRAWMDHEFGSSILSKDQTGWDWFSIQLDDGSDMMISYMRKKDGSIERPFGSLVSKDGVVEDLVARKIKVAPTGTWVSPRTKARYPSGWIVEVPELGIALSVQPSIQDQELVTENSTGVAYWEGSVKVTGKKNGADVSGAGYVELTGYAGSMGGLL